MELRNPSTSDGPHHSSPTPTTTTTAPLAEQIQLQRFNETQMLTGSTSTRSVGIGGDTDAAVRLFETEDGVEEDALDGHGDVDGHGERERVTVLGVFEVDVSIYLPKLIFLILTCS
jgi:hypothetical protein